MSRQDYTLDIISHHSQFKNKTLRKYYVDGIETVGAWGNEPFEIRFRNHTSQKVQVKLSVDGTDILSGKTANTEVSKDMWVVNGYATLSLKAWPETNNGGASFVFTSADNSVAIHTHGDLSSRGIIAAAVFTEGHVEPIRILPPVVDHHHHYHYHNDYRYLSPIVQPVWQTITASNAASMKCRRQSATGNIGEMYSVDSDSSLCDINDSVATETSASLEKLVSVGAGQHVDQKITHVTGLIKPVFTETVRVRYLWWDDLVGKLRTQTKATAHPSGFPADSKKKNIDLGSTPRIGEKKNLFSRADIDAQEFSRV